MYRECFNGVSTSSSGAFVSKSISYDHLARYKWVWMDDIKRLSKKEWESYIPTAYGLVASKLPRKIKQEIGR